MVVFWQAAVQTGRGGMVSPGQGLTTHSTEALRCVSPWRAAWETCSFGRRRLCSMRRGLISGIMLLVKVACKEGRAVPEICSFFLSRNERTVHKSRAVPCEAAFPPGQLLVRRSVFLRCNLRLCSCSLRSLRLSAWPSALCEQGIDGVDGFRRLGRMRASAEPMRRVHGWER